MTVQTVFGADSPLGAAVSRTMQELGIRPDDPQSREQLLAEAIQYRLLEGDTISDASLEAVIRDEGLLSRIRKCRHDCALFADKQQAYDRFRPGWPEEAVRFLVDIIGENAVVADLGSGTGKLAVLLAPRVARLYAVEPSVHMRRVLAARLAEYPQGQIVAATAECTRLPDHSVDAVTIAEAYHWFDNPDARKEIRRILRPDGRVFLLRNHFGGNAYDTEMAAIRQRYHTSPRTVQRTGDQRADDLFGPGRWQRLEFDNTLHQTYDQFLGGMFSASYAPAENTVDGSAFRRDVRALFNAHALRGLLATRITTVCHTGTLPV